MVGDFVYKRWKLFLLLVNKVLQNWSAI